jgi:hypothetical protein
MPRSFKWSLSFRFLPPIPCTHFSFLPYKPHFLHTSHISQLDHPDNDR